MKLIIAAALAATAVAAASAPAFAQPYGPPPPAHGDWHDQDHRGQPDWRDRQAQNAQGEWNLDRRIAWVEDIVNRRQQDGSIGFRDGRRAQRELHNIRGQEAHVRYMHGGQLTALDERVLEDRLNVLQSQLRYSRGQPDRHPW